MSEPGFDYEVPSAVRAGVWANDVRVFRDPEHVTIDFIRIEPRDPTNAFAVARITLPPPCILGLVSALGGVG